MTILNSADKFWGALITGFLLFSIGAFLVWLWPQSVRRKVKQNRVTEEDAENLLSKIRPQGYLLMVIAVAVTLAELWQAGLFGYSKLLAIIPGSISVGLLILWLYHRKNS
jgi:Na+-transporting methylmalonyl-CoA/oxaloacetate decarboxylase gamma subunit